MLERGRTTGLGEQILGEQILHDVESRASTQGSEPLSLLDEITARIYQAAANASVVLANLSSVGDRTFGNEPRKENEREDTKHEPDCAMDRVYGALTMLDYTIRRLEAAENRIRTIA